MTSRRGLLLLAALALASAVVPAGAPAHSILVRSHPSRGATVARAPERIQLWFSERIEPAYAKLSVWNDAGTQVDASDAAVHPNDLTLLSVTTPHLGPGRYTARFRVLSVDGHVVESSFAFSVAATAR